MQIGEIRVGTLDPARIKIDGVKHTAADECIEKPPGPGLVSKGNSSRKSAVDGGMVTDDVKVGVARAVSGNVSGEQPHYDGL